MSVNRGDVVLYRADYVNRPGAKTRPMLVVQNDASNARMANTIVAAITTNIRRAAMPTQVLIDVSTPDGQRSGLHQNSVVTAENLFTVAQAAILRTIGSLPDPLMRAVDDALKVSLGLP